MSENQYRKTSSLHITTQKGETRDYIKDVSFTAPFKITKPFYDENDNMSIMMVSVSAGIMQGDNQEITVDVLENSKATIFSQSYEKIHKMRGGLAKRHTSLNVAKGGFLIYSPLPTIPFADSSFITDTDIVLEDSTSKLAYSEILSCGRAGRGERFEYKLYKALLKVTVGDELVYYENAKYIPDETNMEETCMFEGYSHLSNMVLVNLNLDDEQLTQIRDIIEQTPDVEGGASFSYKKDIVVRVLANSSEKLLAIHDKIMKVVSE